MQIQYSIVITCLCGLVTACGLDPNAPTPEGSSGDTIADTIDDSNAGSDSNDAGSDSNDSSNTDPVAACEELEDALASCQPVFEGALSCSVYADIPCDLAPWLNCIEDAYGTCVDGNFPDLDQNEIQNCAPLAVCN